MEAFVTKTLELLEMERETEVEDNRLFYMNASPKKLRKKITPKVRLKGCKTGLFGRTLVTFDAIHNNSRISIHDFSIGDNVGIKGSKSNNLEADMCGLVTHISSTSITVAFEKDCSIDSLTESEDFYIIQLVNDITYRRIKQALTALKCNQVASPSLVDILFGEREPDQIESSKVSDLQFTNEHLNSIQKEAILFTMQQKQLSVIHGPPGTGKTTTLVEIILQAVSMGQKVIACAPSNVAVDNLVEKLAMYNVKMIRLGHPARLSETIHRYCLDAVISNQSDNEVIDDIYEEIDKLKTTIASSKYAGERTASTHKRYSLIKDLRQRESKLMKDVLKNCSILLATLSSAASDGPIKHLPPNFFDVAILDECSQALEASCWIPLLLVSKCVVAGDFNQLPPVIHSEKAREEGLGETLMDRLIKVHGNKIVKMLKVQYRMNEAIMSWASAQMYNNELLAHSTVQNHLLCHLPNVEEDENTSVPLLLIDTAGCINMEEMEVEEQDSKGNPGEAALVAFYAQSLIKSGVKPCDIAIISPYSLQVDIMKDKLYSKYKTLEVRSVDGFQGREKEAVILSLVRSNDKGIVGFLSDDRRINVAITRARRHLAVICNSETVSHSPFLKSFVEYLNLKGEVRSALQYEKEIDDLYSLNVSKHSSYVRKIDKPKQSSSESKKKKIQTKEPSDPIISTEDTSSRRNILRERYENLIKEFLKGKDECLVFPTSLTSYERRVVHEVAEDLHLIHTSHGEEDERYIEIKRQPKVTENNHIRTSEIHTVIPKKFLLEAYNTDDTSILNSGTCENNSLCEVISSSPSTSEAISSPPSTSEAIFSPPSTSKSHNQHNVKSAKQTASKQKIKNKTSQTKSLEKKLSEQSDDFDSIIETVIQCESTCYFLKCKKPTSVLGQICPFCKKRFCFSHFMPEIHGCGDNAKAHARSEIRKEGVLYPGSGKPSKKLDAATHSHLKNKLDKRISELSKSRSVKPKH